MAHPISANCSSNSSIKTATANSATTNAPVANRFRIFSVNNKATKPHPADPEPVAPVRVVPAVPAKAAGADLSVEVDRESDAVPVQLSAGDAAVLHCHLLHRSEGNLSTDRDRRILFLRYADADAVEVYNARQPRLGPLLRGKTRYPEVAAFERELFAENETS